MGKSNIDAIIQHKLTDHKTSLDKEALWSAIAGDVTGGNTPTDTGAVTASTTSILKVIGFSLLATITLASVYFLATNDTPVASKSVSEVTAAQLSNDKDISETVSHEVIEDVARGQIGGVEDQNVEKEMMHGESGKGLKPINKIDGNDSKSVATRSVTTNTINQQETTVNYSAGSSTTPVTIKNNTLPTRQSIQNETLNNFVKTSSSTTLEYQASVAKQSTSAIKQLTIATLYGIGYDVLNTESHDILIDDSNLLPLKDKVNCYSYKQRKANISVLGYYGPGVSIRSLESNGPEMETLVQERNNSEVILENHRAGLQLKARHRSGLYLKGGIEASIINEKFQQFTRDTTMEVREVVIEIIEYPDGSTEEIYGDQLVTIISNNEWRKFNDFKTVDLSAIIGYESGLGNWKYAVEAGAIFNLNSEFNGTFLQESTLQPTGDTADLFKSRTGIDLHFGIGVGYTIGNALTIWAMPSLRSDLQAVNNSDYLVNQSYQLTNLLLGVEYQF